MHFIMQQRISVPTLQRLDLYQALDLGSCGRSWQRRFSISAYGTSRACYGCSFATSMAWGDVAPLGGGRQTICKLLKQIKKNQIDVTAM
jgi:hypothetical protein